MKIKRYFMAFIIVMPLLIFLACEDKITTTSTGGGGGEPPNTTVTSFRITNDTGEPILSLGAMNPSTGAYIPFEILEDVKITNGITVTVVLHEPYITADNKYHLWLRADSQTWYSKENVTITENGIVRFTNADKALAVTVIINTSETNFGSSWYAIYPSGELIRQRSDDLENEQSPDYKRTESRPNDVWNAQIRFRSPNNLYDIMIAYGSWNGGYTERETTYTKRNVLITSDRVIEINDNDRDPIYTIYNNTGTSIESIYWRQSGTTTWKTSEWDDGYTSLPSGSFVVRSMFFLNQNSRYDIQMRSISGSTFTKSNQLMLDYMDVHFTSADTDAIAYTFTLINEIGSINGLEGNHYDIYIAHNGTSDLIYQACIQELNTLVLSITAPSPNNRYDIMLRRYEDISFTKMNVLIQQGAVIRFAMSDCDFTTIESYTTFENNNHGWSTLNGSEIDQWHVGSATASDGSRSMYISNDNGVSNAYTVGSGSIVHFYRVLNTPLGSVITVNFDAKNSTNTQVCTSVRSRLPIPGELYSSSGSWYMSWWSYYSYWTTQRYDSSYIFSETTYLIFSWDGTDIWSDVQPPAAIDNIYLRIWVPIITDEITSFSDMPSFPSHRREMPDSRKEEKRVDHHL